VFDRGISFQSSLVTYIRVRRNHESTTDSGIKSYHACQRLSSLENRSDSATLFTSNSVQCRSPKITSEEYSRGQCEFDNSMVSTSEVIKVEDRTRDKVAYARELNARPVPIVVQKLIKTLKTSVHKTMRKNGGTPFSIIRQMFLYWDREKTGYNNESVLTNCLLSLGVKIVKADIQAVVSYYSTGVSVTGVPQMSYMDLLRDVNKDEPTLTVFVDPVREDLEDTQARYEFNSDQYKEKPPVVREFLDAVRLLVAAKMRREGGTMYSHVRKAFLMADFDYSNALDATEFIFAMKRGLGLVVTESQSKAVLKFYDRKGLGECDYSLLLRDLEEEGVHMLQFVDYSPRTIAKSVTKMKSNQFMHRPFRPKPNKLFEAIRLRLRAVLYKKISIRGGSLRSWLKEAFVSWDPQLTGRITHWQGLQGSLRAVGLVVTKDEADCILDCFTKKGETGFNYSSLIDDIAPRDHSFLHPEVEEDGYHAAETATARAPTNVSRYIAMFLQKVNNYATQSLGTVKPRDVLHGTFLRYDSRGTGKVGLKSLTSVAENLRVHLSEDRLQALLDWFDSDGSGTMDYCNFVV
jgi:Ca2+-binding EF-hand superfamily protein